MEKVQAVLQYLRKYHFWLLCVVVIVAGVVGWMMAGSTLTAEYTKKKSEIEGKFSSLNQIQQVEFPPNSNWKSELEKLIGEERKKVAETWQSVYDEQQKVLEWPSEQDLGKDFHAWIVRQKPNTEIPDRWRTYYRDSVANKEFRKLPEIVGAKLDIGDTKDNGAVEAAGGGPTYKVSWDSASQNQVKQALEMSNVGIPDSLAVWLKQEDLWVYRSLLNILRETNASATYISHVKQIDGISIGTQAAKLFQDGMKPGHIDKLTTGEAGGADPGSVPGAGADDGPRALDEGRYVDASGTPQPSGAWQNEQVKRMPIHLRLVMDQREIPRLLSQCANSPLPVEVLQMRINPDSSASSSSKKEEAGAPTAFGAYDVTVEIHGVVSIYNPPDPAKLGQSPAGTETAAM